MPRIRTIQPNFPRSTSMTRVSRDARLLFILLWTVVDDAGRARAVPDGLAALLYASDSDAPTCLPGWLDELEREGCIERYAASGGEHLRVVNWRRHQYVQRPTPSRLPPSPRERVRRSGKTPESSGWAHEAGANSLYDRDYEGRSAEPPELFEETGPVDNTPLTPESVLHDLRRLRAKSEAKGSFTAAVRLVELMGRHINFWSVKGSAKADRKGVVESSGPSLAELHGMNRAGE
jgi:hypothetical protein